MEQVGTVSCVNGSFATVTVNRTTSCGENCAHCKGGCTPTTVSCEAKNSAGAKIGDVVRIETNTKKVLGAAFFLYMFPLLVSIVSAIAVSGFLKNSSSVLVACAAFLLSFCVIKRFEKRIVPVSYITKIIKPKTELGKA